MTKQIDEQISAFMDGEVHQSEHSAMIKQLCRDDDSLNRWQNYHLISDTLRNNLPPATDNQFAQSVMKALENEPTIFAPSAMKHKSTVKQKIAGAAIAASVAAVAVIGVQTMNQPKEMTPSLAEMPSTDQYVRMEQLANSSTVQSTSPAFVAKPNVSAMKASASESAPSSAQVTQINKYHPNLNKYLLNHNQHTLGSRVQGVMPYARIVVTPTQAQVQELKEQGK
ncbi:sigma-E factor negative regulatory protein [Kaarinaea lacus]